MSKVINLLSGLWVWLSGNWKPPSPKEITGDTVDEIIRKFRSPD